MVKRRRTDMTEEQREVLEACRRMLVPHFPGEVIKLHVPTRVRDELVKRIEAAIAAGERPDVISQREDVSKRHIRRIRGRIG